MTSFWCGAVISAAEVCSCAHTLHALIATHGHDRLRVALYPGRWPQSADEHLDGLMNVLDDVLKIIAVQESKDDSCTTWQMRVQLAAAILDLMMIDTEVRLATSA